jgi:hypothetical protein
MTIENGAQEAANDTVLPDDQDETCAPQQVDVEYEGKTYRLPAELKDALLRQADYTRKTQDVAQARKALDAERQVHQSGAEVTRAHLTDAARVVALNDQLAHFDRIDWRTLESEDPARAKALWQAREQIRNLRDRAARAWTEKEQEHASHSQRATARRLGEVSAHLPRLIADWSPELDVKLAQYGTAHGLTREEMAQATLQNRRAWENQYGNSAHPLAAPAVGQDVAGGAGGRLSGWLTNHLATNASAGLSGLGLLGAAFKDIGAAQQGRQGNALSDFGQLQRYAARYSKPVSTNDIARRNGPYQIRPQEPAWSLPILNPTPLSTLLP